MGGTQVLPRQRKTSRKACEDTQRKITHLFIIFTNKSGSSYLFPFMIFLVTKKIIAEISICNIYFIFESIDYFYLNIIVSKYAEKQNLLYNT